nr:MAG TPA: hypothetical protein [Caudoviricetes sp.]
MKFIQLYPSSGSNLFSVTFLSLKILLAMYIK